MRIWRVYYNWRRGYPYIWCIDEGDISTQRQMRTVKFDHAIARGQTSLKGPQTKPLAVNEPAAWFEVRGDLEVRRLYHATFTADRGR
jgi:hypothetical protein